MKATYGVMGMMEWIALIPTANNTVRVRFSGGSLSGYGVTPATFTTSNPVLIKMIEGSSYFRSGKIKLIRREDKLSDDDSTAACDISSPPHATSDPSGGNGYVTFKKIKH